MVGKNDREGFSFMDMRRPAQNQKLFWFILLGVMIFSVGVLVGVATLFFTTTRSTDAATQLSVIRLGLELFYADTGRFPTVAEGLSILTAPGSKGPYISKEVIVDPWGRPFLYAFPGLDGVPVVSSLGADGVPGGSGVNADLKARPILPVMPPASQSNGK